MNSLPGSPGARMRLSPRIILTVGVIAFVIFFCLGGLLLLASAGMENLFGAADLAVELTYPPSVAVGDSFELTAALRNPTEKEVTLTEIQVPKSLLEGLDVLSLDPPAGGAAIDYIGQVGYPLSVPIPPGQTRRVTIVFKARLPGDFTGSLRSLTGRRSAVSPITLQVAPGPSSRIPVRLAARFDLPTETQLK